MSLFLKVAPNKRQNAKNANLIVLAKNARVNERVHERGLEMPRHSEPESGVHCSGPVEGTVRVSHVTVSKNYVFLRLVVTSLEITTTLQHIVLRLQRLADHLFR